MANYNNTHDLKMGVLHRCGEPTDGTSEYDSKVIEYINRAHQATLSGAAELGLELGQPWPWAINKYPSILTLQPKITSIAVAVTALGTTITFGSQPAQNLKDWFIRLDGDAEPYRIKTHNGTSLSAIIDQGYLGSTNAAASCTIFKLDYELDDCVLRLIAPFSTFKNTMMSAADDGQIHFCDLSRFSADYPINKLMTGTPDMGTQIFKDTDTMTPIVRFNSIPDSLLRVEYNYIPVPDDLTDDDDSIPLVPRDHRIILEYYASYFLALDKNDSRVIEFRDLAKASIMAMDKAAKKEKLLTNPNFGQMVPRPDLVSRNRLWWRYYV